jgi:hypothetical protein
MDARRANDRIAEKAQQLRFLSRAPMMCECDKPGCRTIVMISLDEFAEIRRDPNNFLIAPGHQLEGAELQRETPAYTIRRRNGESNGRQRSA